MIASFVNGQAKWPSGWMSCYGWRAFKGSHLEHALLVRLGATQSSGIVAVTALAVG